MNHKFLPTVSVAPLKRMPFSRCCFDYTPGKLKLTPGDLVKIPFRASSLPGIVLGPGSGEKIKTRLKPVTEKIFSAPALSAPQLTFLREISDIYHTNLNFILKTAILPIQPRKIKKINLPPLPPPITNPPSKPRVYINEDNKSEISYLKKNITATGQILILTPGADEPSLISARLKKIISQKIITLRGNDSEKIWFDRWLAVRAEPNIVVIGTRKALFLPWTNLTAIYILDEGNADYKSWDMAPRIHTRDATILLARQFSATLHLLSPAPSVETYFFAKNKIYDGLKSPIKKMINAPWIIDTRSEKRNPDFSGLSPRLLDTINELPQGDIFLYLNRRDSGHYIFCRDCQKTARCPDCGRILNTREKNLECSEGHRSYPAGRCPHCQSSNIASFAPGASELKKVIQQKLGNRFDIITIEKNRVEKSANNRRKIVIGTRHAWSSLDWSNLGLMAFLDADSSLYIPEYRVAEELWQNIHAAANRLPTNANLFLLTENPDHPVFAFIPQPENFYRAELAQRKILNYPPYSFILKLYTPAPNQNLGEVSAKKLIARLLDLTREEKNVMINGPFTAPRSGKQTGFYAVILIKIGYERYKTVIKKINAILADDAWQVDPNPANFLKF